MAILTNLRPIKRSRILPAQGDVFAMRLPMDRHLFGRVILADAPREHAPMPGAYLLYIYKWQAKTLEVEHQRLKPDALLMAPVWTNRLGWTKGYFHTVARLPLTANALLKQHCFRRYDGVFLDERGKRLPRRSEPCGEWGLVSYRWIDDHVSDAVGIERVSASDE